MKTHYDAEADALYVRFASDDIIESEEVRPNLILDFDAQGKIVAIEMLKAKEQVSGDLASFVETVPA